jgi:hypothetical protein
MYSYIYMTFEVGWEPHIFDWPGLHPTSIRPWAHFTLCRNPVSLTWVEEKPAHIHAALRLNNHKLHVTEKIDAAIKLLRTHIYL